MIAPQRAEVPITIHRMIRPAAWTWYCRPCQRSDAFLDWQRTLASGLNHLHTAHGCPSLRASGEPCGSYCADCGGRMWIH